jgi:hypothetical protein
MTLVTRCASLKRVRTIICGHSNAAPLYRVLVPARDETTPSIELGLRHGLAGLHTASVEPDYLNLIRRLGRTRNVAFVWEGNQANADFLLMPGRPFDFVPRGYPDTSVLPGAQVIPEACIREHLRPSLDPLNALLRDVGRPTGLLRVVVGIQPPLADNRLIRDRLTREPHYGRRAAEFGVDLAAVPIAPASVRHKLWFTLTEMYRETARRHGAFFIEPPQEACDKDGFMRVDHSGGDATHAGLPYGALMIDRLSSVLSAHQSHA